MMPVVHRLGITLLLIATTLAFAVEPAAAHTGNEASTGHIVVEFGQWGFGVTGVIAAVLFAFWVRARFRQGSSE